MRLCACLYGKGAISNDIIINMLLKVCVVNVTLTSPVCRR